MYFKSYFFFIGTVAGITDQVGFNKTIFEGNPVVSDHIKIRFVERFIKCNQVYFFNAVFRMS